MKVRSAASVISENLVEKIMIRIKQILAQKTKPLTTVKPTDTVQHAVELMRDFGIGAVMVLEEKKLVGLFTSLPTPRSIASLS